MEWWLVLTLAAVLTAVALHRGSQLAGIAALAAFAPLGVHTVLHDFDRFWIIITAAMAAELALLARLALSGPDRPVVLERSLGGMPAVAGDPVPQANA